MVEEYISRNDAIEAVYRRIHQIGLETDPLVLSIQQAILDIPAAAVRPVVRGEWEEEDSASNRWSFRCSVCGEGGRGYKFNFCPNCGADMREES